MKTYIPITENSEYREVYDSYMQTVDNLNDVDFLYSSMLSNGQVFFKNNDVYGTVNGQPALRNTNIYIPREYIDDFRISDFILYTRATNELITLDINCNLANYRDNKIHYLYVILDPNGTYEVYDDMFQSDETKILFARFIIDTTGDSKQFYIMLPFAGSADYIKGNQFYQVTDGLRVQVVNANTKRLTVSNAKIRFSAINFDDKASPDCIEIDHGGNALPIRYVYWDATSNIPRVDWDEATSYTLKLNKIMNYSTGTMSSVATGSFSIQKFYYDVYTRCIVAMYGNASYNTREGAILAIDSVMSYPLPDGIEYLIPIACIVMQNTSDPISDANFRIINLDYNEQEVLDSDTFTRQQAAEAVAKANQAESEVASLSSILSTHTGNRANPHRVRVDQLLKSDGTAGPIDDSLTDITLAQILAQAASGASNLYYSKNGGTISGNASITGTLTVAGKTTLEATDTGALKVSGSISFDSENRTIGASNKRLGYLYAKNISASLTSYLADVSCNGNVTPNYSNSYALGNSNYRWSSGYFVDLNVSGTLTGNYINASNNLTAGGYVSAGTDVYGANKLYSASGDIYTGSGNIYTISGNISAGGTMTCSGQLWTKSTFRCDSTASFSGRITASGGINCNSSLDMANNQRINVNNGYIVIGGYSLRLGSDGSIPTTYGYGIW